MYFFDIEDYCTSGFIGQNSIDFSLYGSWEDPATTYRATRDAFFKAVNQWYLATTADKDPSVCERCEQIKNDLYFSFTDDTRISDFWDNADNNNMVDLTQQQFNDYQDAMFEQMCLLKNLMNCLDGDTFSASTPCYIGCNSYPYVSGVDFMDDPYTVPTSAELTSFASENCGCDYTDYSSIVQSYQNYLDWSDNFYNNIDPNMNEFKNQLNVYNVAKSYGFCDGHTGVITPDVSLITTTGYSSNFYVKGTPYKLKGYKPCKASQTESWYYNAIGSRLSANTDDVRYIVAVENVGDLPPTGQPGDLICVGVPTSFVGYAWDPTIPGWSSSFYLSMEDLFSEWRAKRDFFSKAKNELILAMKPFTWSNNYLLLHPIKRYPLSGVEPFTGQDIIDSNGDVFPCPYPRDINQCDTNPFCGPNKHDDTDVC